MFFLGATDMGETRCSGELPDWTHGKLMVT